MSHRERGGQAVAVWHLAGALALSGCMGLRYIPHVAMGQLKLSASSRPIEEVRSDPAVDERTRNLLGEIEALKAYARRNGLRIRQSYETYAEFDREYVVWFVNGSKPLVFEPRTYWFPIVGSFAGLGWFNEDDANRHARRLRRRGWDASVRGASAYSTGGWFRDPVVSSMFDEGEAAHGDLVNVILHESVHATVLVNNQTYFNESLASFVADQMTPEYLEVRYGRYSPEREAWLLRERERAQIDTRLSAAYSYLDAVYSSERPESRKQEIKDRVMTGLARDLDLRGPPNNALLLGAKLYGAGKAELARLYASCGHDWRRLLTVTATLTSKDFGEKQQEDIGGVIAQLAANDCRPLP